MAFPRHPTITPVAIEGIRVTLTDSQAVGDPSDPVYGYRPPIRAAHYRVEVRMDNGEVRELQGDLVPYLTQAQISGLLTFMADLRLKAQAEIL